MARMDQGTDYSKFEPSFPKEVVPFKSLQAQTSDFNLFNNNVGLDFFGAVNNPLVGGNQK
jgi:hypothetical protein